MRQARQSVWARGPGRIGLGARALRLTVAALGLGLLWAAAPAALAAEAGRVHGLWVWKGPTVLATTPQAQQLAEFCRAQGINEVYVSVFDHGRLGDAAALTRLIGVLHAGGVRIEALLSSTDADQPGKHRDSLLARVREVQSFNGSHARTRFDGLHLDIEPQQRPENKGAGNLRFLPDLTATYREVRALAEPAGLSVNADIQNKLLKGSAAQRRELFRSLPRLTLMLYEVSDTDAGRAVAKTEALRTASARYLEMTYAGLTEPDLAMLAIGLRTPDYGELLPQMLKSVDEANAANPHYLGWARHSYNDVLKVQP
jgi:hypothetical protein